MSTRSALLSIVANAAAGNDSAKSRLGPSGALPPCAVRGCRCAAGHCARSTDTLCAACQHGIMYHVAERRRGALNGPSKDGSGPPTADESGAADELRRVTMVADDLEHAAALKLTAAAAHTGAPGWSGNAPTRGARRQKLADALGYLVGALDALSTWRTAHSDNESHFAAIGTRMRGMIEQCDEIRAEMQKGDASDAAFGARLSEDGMPAADAGPSRAYDDADGLARPFDIDDAAAPQQHVSARRDRGASTSADKALSSGSSTDAGRAAGTWEGAAPDSTAGGWDCFACGEFVARPGDFCQCCGSRRPKEA